MTTARQAGKEFTLKVKPEQLVGQCDFVAREIVCKLCERLLRITALKGLSDRIAFSRVREC